MWFYGILVGAAAFLIIGALHPVVIKCEYYFGTKVWPAFLAAGACCLALSAVAARLPVSAVLGVAGFSFLWSIHELFAQRARVQKGWFPAHPHRRRLYRGGQGELGPGDGEVGSGDGKIFGNGDGGEGNVNG
jgi:hypothetical protein